MSNRNSEGDMTHSFSADLLFSYLDLTPVADDSTIADSLVLSAVAFVILGGSENLLAEKTVPLGLIGSVVDRLRLKNLSTGPLGDVLRRSERDADRLEIALDLILFVIECRHIVVFRLQSVN